MIGATFRADRRLAVTAPVLTVLAQVAAPLTALGVKLAIDAALAHDRSRAVFAALLATSVAALLYLLSLLATRVTTTLDDRLGLFLDEELTTAATGFPGLEHFETPSLLDQFTLLRSDRSYLLSAAGLLVGVLGITARLTVTLVLLASVSPVLLAVPLLILPALALVRSRAGIQNAVEVEVAPRVRLAENLFRLATDPAAGKEARAYRIQDMLAERFEAVQTEIDRLRNRALLKSATLATLAWALFGLGFVGGALLAVNRAVAGQATAGDVIMTLYLIGQIQAETGAIFATTANLTRTVAAGERLLNVQRLARSRHGSASGSASPPERLAEGIRMRGVCFTYPNGTTALQDVEIELPVGSTVAIVGENGAGKSTLVKLLCALYEPASGDVAVDGTALADIDVEEWRSGIAASFQDFVRFETTAREAVGLGDLPRLSDDAAIRTALERAGATPVVDELPDGLDTQLGRQWDRGAELSTGQWQRLALARAGMREAPVLLILDEPTASVDAATEHEIHQRFAAANNRARGTGTITVLVTHRFSTVAIADHILVLQDGRIVEQGSHHELLEKDGVYAELYRLHETAYR
jgi:ATP-binding cassette subfamily B protein